MRSIAAALTAVTVLSTIGALAPAARISQAPAQPPIGSITAWAGPKEKVPTGWMLCQGEGLDRTKAENKPLFDAIGTSWGGDGANIFYVPDLRGRFLRGVDMKQGRDPQAG